MKKEVLHTYATYNNNENIRMKSSSGGIFTVFAELIIKNGGVVYGVAMSEDCYSNHFERVDTIDALSKLRGSKYVQARIGDTYKCVQHDLKNGVTVLFSGTGCQINGLKSYLINDYDNLICVDVVCHGVPSQKVWKKYVEFVEAKRGKLVSINFRSKETSWSDFGFKENEVFVPKDEDVFFQLFNRCYCLRPSCYHCVAKDDKRSDVTIADFWGIENVLPEFNDNKGMSLVLIRTEKGNDLFQSIKEECSYREVTYEEGIRENSSEYVSHNKPEGRVTFFRDFEKMTIPQLENKYIKGSLWKRVGRKIKRTIKQIFGGEGGTTVRQRSNADYGLLFTFEK